tara:strand:+ start:114308 stop:114634 length:327 start_codon:yes stop_codon:yes gene_type:complete
MKNNNLSKLERAQKRVKDIKGFYNHAVIYVIINSLLLIFKERFVFTILSKNAIGDPDFLRWIDWNVYGTPIIWGIGLLVHGICVFNATPKFLKNWEERKIKKYMQEEE